MGVPFPDYSRDCRRMLQMSMSLTTRRDTCSIPSILSTLHPPPSALDPNPVRYSVVSHHLRTLHAALHRY